MLSKKLSIPSIHRPIGRYFRRKRFARFWSTFGLGARTRVLDLGGYEYYWGFFDRKPRVTIVNLDRPATPSREFDWVVADALRLPFRDKTFQVVFANSIIEHVPGDSGRREFAREVARVGERYYVQTPYRWFPVEPHLMTPLIHYLPKGIQRKLLRNFTVWGVLVRPTPEGCDAFLRDVQLLNERELRQLFPQAEIWRERVLGLTKSLIAAYMG